MNLTYDQAVGADAFAVFELEVGRCRLCGSLRPQLCIRYTSKLTLPSIIKPEDTILKGTKPGAIGVTCGCYAKFHRQVVHIQERMNQRAR